MLHHTMKVAGIDTGKTELHACLLPGKSGFSVANNAEGIADLVARCREAGVARVAVEATSIYHRAAAHALERAGMEVAVLQPRQARAFATAILQWAKSDRIDASVIARLAQVIDPPRPVPSEKTEALAELLTYVEHLEERSAWLKTTRERFTAARLAAAITADIKRLDRCRQAALRSLVALLRKDAELASRLDLLVSIPGVAERTAAGLLIRMPELGSMSREQAARLAGLAPCLDESSKHQGERHIYGGRARLRKTLFMAAFVSALQWNPDLKAFYNHLRQNGKAHTAAVIACARKLVILANTILARKTPWKPKTVMP